MTFITQARLKEKLEYTDLTEEQTLGKDMPSLRLARMDRYLHGPTPMRATQYNTSEDILEAHQVLSQDMMAWKPNLSQVAYTLWLAIV